MKKYLLLVRHAESHNNADRNRFSGIVDTPITENGRNSSRLLANKLSKFTMEKILTSRLERAKETAEIVFPDVPIQVCDELMEFNYGDYEGLSPDDLPGNDPIIELWRKSPGTISFPCGQNVAEYAEQLWRGMHNLMSKISENKIGCIIHKTMGRLFVAQILGLDLNHFRSIPMDNCGVSIVTWDSSEGFQLHSLNMTVSLFSDTKEEIWNH